MNGISRYAVFGIFLVVGGLIGALLVWTLTGAGERGTGVGRGALDSPEETFTLTGELTTVISPGVYAPLDLSITNPNEHDLAVTDIVVTVDSVVAPRATDELPCTVEDFDVKQVSSRLEVPVEAGITATLAELGVPSTGLPQVGMLLLDSRNQDGCKGASLTLAFTAVGRVVE
jgi:hypothetical protein